MGSGLKFELFENRYIEQGIAIVEYIFFLKSKLFLDVWKGHGKYFPVFGYVMKNKLEDSLLMLYFFFKFIKIIRTNLTN